MSMTDAERARRYRERRKADAKPVVVRWRKPKDRRTKPQQWAAACATLLDVLDGYQDWKDNMPGNLADSVLADKLDEVLALRDLVEQLEAAELPKGFGRD